MDKNSLSVAFGGSPAFLPEEIDIFLNQGLNEKVYNKFTGTNPTNTPFEGSIKRVSDLEQLVKTDSNVTVISSPVYQNGIEIPFKETTVGRKRMLLVQVVLQYQGQKYPCMLINHELSSRYSVAYNNIPWIPQPVVFIESDNICVLLDRTYITNPESATADITFVDTPPVIDYTKPDEEIVDIPDNVMMEAINRAVVIALENIESARTESKVQINNLQE